MGTATFQFAHIELRVAFEPYHAPVFTKGDGNARPNIQPIDACVPTVTRNVIELPGRT